MTYPGLDAGFEAALVASHSIRTRVEALDLGMNPVGQTLTSALLDGQVNVDADAEVTRSLTVSLLDRDRMLGLDSTNPSEGAVYADRMLRVWYGVRAPLGDWQEVPLFTGPAVKMSRDGAVVSVECQGKEALARGSSVWRTMNFEKHDRKRDVIRAVMRALGERHFSFEELPGKLPGPRSLTPEDDPWEFVQRLADSMNAQLYYDGYGRLRLRRILPRSVWTFRTGTGGTILDAPKVSHEADAKNAVRVVGKKPKGAKEKVRAQAVAPATHPLSLKRPVAGGEEVRIYRAAFVEDSSIGSKREAQRVANRTLKQLLVASVSVEFSSLVVPHLDPGDVVTVQTADFTAQTRLAKFTVPLNSSATMSVGYHRRINRPTKPRRA